MRVIPLRPESPHDPITSGPRGPLEEGAMRELRSLLFDSHEPLPLPALTDILSAALALAEGSRKKSLLPLGTAPAELVLMRRASDVLVSYYLIDGPTDVRVLDRPVALRELLHACASAAERLGSVDAEPTSRELTLRLADRARATLPGPESEELAPVRKSGGAVELPRDRVPLAFGFEASIVPVADPPRQTTAHSDAHALLFPGTLWVWARGRRIQLARGPIMLVIQRMVAAVRSMIEAWEKGRPANVRLKAGGFAVGVRLAKSGPGPVQLTLGSEQVGTITVPELEVCDAALPILRLASDVLRALVSVDRSQARNLRLTSLREEVRSLRRRVRERGPKAASIVHGDPERLRAASGAPRPQRGASTAGQPAPGPRALRFDVRWEAEVEGLDATSTFLCGDRLVIATPRQTVALDRDDARVLWAHTQPASVSFMTGTVLAQLASDGRLALSHVIDGEPFAETRLAPRTGGPPCGILAGGGSIPPVAVVGEGRDRLVAVDLRSGELRWRSSGHGPGAISLLRAGRILLTSSGDGTISALDVSNGELLWRLSLEDACFTHPPAISGDVVLAVSGDLGGDEGVLYGVDLFSGRVLWRRALDAPPACGPMAASDVATIALGGPRRASLAAFDPTNGELRWMVPDPGAALGGACLAVDRLLIVNAPAGRVAALSLDDGRARWERTLSHPVADDVPRRLEPILRGGALFVPSAAVHVLRPHDGTSIGEALPCELVPDWTRVDERGWVYVAEESGHLTALAPRPSLSLVQ